jgi:predicted Rossmann fold nucleotide-binding protein DprA/Smf involved in DNA uptake
MLLDVVGSFARARAPDVDDLDARILDALASSPAGPDSLARRVGMNAGDLSSRLARLVIRGVVAASPDGRFVRR